MGLTERLAAVVLSTLGLVPAAAQVHYLECAPSPEALADGRAARVMVDRERARVVWMERSAAGVWRRDELEILTTTPREVVASGLRDGDSLHLGLDLAEGTWRREVPLPRAENRNAWNAGEQRLGYPESAQLFGRATGVCRVMEEAR